MASFGKNLFCRCVVLRAALRKIPSSTVLCSAPKRGIVNPRWRQRFGREMYDRRLEVGPEPDRHRSAWINWNYDSEIFAFGKRLGEDFNEEILRKAFVHRSYLDAESQKRSELGFGADMTPVQLQDNQELVETGRGVSSTYIQAFLRFSYPYLPEEGIRAVHDYLMADDVLALVGGYVGIRDLILCQELPPLVSTLAKTLLAVIGALTESQGKDRAENFVRDFVLPQLVGKDINEMWSIVSPMTLLTDILTAQGQLQPEARLIRESASTTVMSLYWVGIYCNKQLIGEAPGETVTIAEEMAARDALKEIFRTTDYQEPLKFGLRGEDVNLNFDHKNLTIEQYSQPQNNQSQKAVVDH